MDSAILTPENLARHIQWQEEHARVEKLFHTSREAILLAMGAHNTWSSNGYVVLIREYERRIFRHKLLALDYPDIHERFLEVIAVRQLIVTGPNDIVKRPVPGIMFR